MCSKKRSCCEESCFVLSTNLIALVPNILFFDDCWITNSGLNPRHSHTFSDEDMMMVLKGTVVTKFLYGLLVLTPQVYFVDLACRHFFICCSQLATQVGQSERTARMIPESAAS